MKKNEAEFIRQVCETSAVQREQTAKAHRRRIAKEKKRVAELNTLIRKIYEDNVAGRLTDKRFEILSTEYESEQAALEQSIEICKMNWTPQAAFSMQQNERSNHYGKDHGRKNRERTGADTAA